MGKVKKWSILALVLFPISIATAMVVKYNAYLVNDAGVAYNKTYSLPLNSYGIDNLSFVAVASSDTFSNVTFTDGSKSTGTISVVSNTGLAATSASDYLTVLSTNSLDGAILTVNGVSLINGVHWFTNTTTALTAVSIKNAITANVSNLSVSTGASSTVYSTATVAGSYGNSMSLASNSSSVTVNSASFTGGADAANLSINGFPISFTVGATSSNTAVSIANGINSNANLNTVIIATNNTTGTVVIATSSIVGLVTNYTITSSTQAALTIGGSTVTVQGLNGAGIGRMWGGTNSAYTLVGGSATVINATAHGYVAGLPVLYSTGSAQSITGLTTQTTYYVIPVNANSLSLASSSALAQAGTALVLTSSQTKTAADSFTLAPLAIAGTPSYKWQVSNDASTWSDYTTTSTGQTVSSVSMGAYYSTGTVTVWDLGSVGYAYIRLSVTAPTAGAIKLVVTGNGKNTAQ